MHQDMGPSSSQAILQVTVAGETMVRSHLTDRFLEIVREGVEYLTVGTDLVIAGRPPGTGWVKTGKDKTRSLGTDWYLGRF